VEVLAGILSGSGFVNPKPGPDEMNGIFLLALDPAWFQPLHRFREQVDQLTAYIKASRPMPGAGPIHIPGEGSRAEAARHARAGIFLNDAIIGRLLRVLRDLGLPADPLPLSPDGKGP
jgi:LDH2 family malate/lactate/ureidoglycolate dehydrogenase